MVIDLEDNNNKNDDFRAGYVAIIGAPNVGKSTLLNALLGQKLSIVSDKPQTTRHKILGIYTRDNLQIIFLDTPGLLKPKYLLHEAMMKSAEAAIHDADAVLLIVDGTTTPKSITSGEDIGLNHLIAVKKPVILAINKIDILGREKAFESAAAYSQKFQFDEIYPISAKNSTGLRELTEGLSRLLPHHPPFYPADIMSELPEKFFVAEIIREKIFEKFREEIPYSTTVDIIEFKEKKGRKDVIRAEIYLERDSQKGILIGKKGQALKEIGELARKDIESFLERPVFLELHVKVRSNWREKKEWLKRLGYGEK
ncbi:MAG: GTPase Era [Bacteroidota bacterium]